MSTMDSDKHLPNERLHGSAREHSSMWADKQRAATQPSAKAKQAATPKSATTIAGPQAETAAHPFSESLFAPDHKAAQPEQAPVAAQMPAAHARKPVAAALTAPARARGQPVSIAKNTLLSLPPSQRLFAQQPSLSATEPHNEDVRVQPDAHALTMETLQAYSDNPVMTNRFFHSAIVQHLQERGQLRGRWANNERAQGLLPRLKEEWWGRAAKDGRGGKYTWGHPCDDVEFVKQAVQFRRRLQHIAEEQQWRRAHGLSGSVTEMDGERVVAHHPNAPTGPSKAQAKRKAAVYPIARPRKAARPRPPTLHKTLHTQVASAARALPERYIEQVTVPATALPLLPLTEPETRTDTRSNPAQAKPAEMASSRADTPLARTATPPPDVPFAGTATAGTEAAQAGAEAGGGETSRTPLISRSQLRKKLYWLQRQLASKASKHGNAQRVNVPPAPYIPASFFVALLPPSAAHTRPRTHAHGVGTRASARAQSTAAPQRQAQGLSDRASRPASRASEPTARSPASASTSGSTSASATAAPRARTQPKDVAAVMRTLSQLPLFHRNHLLSRFRAKKAMRTALMHAQHAFRRLHAAVQRGKRQISEDGLVNIHISPAVAFMRGRAAASSSALIAQAHGGQHQQRTDAHAPTTTAASSRGSPQRSTADADSQWPIAPLMVQPHVKQMMRARDIAPAPVSGQRGQGASSGARVQAQSKPIVHVAGPGFVARIVDGARVENPGAESYNKIAGERAISRHGQDIPDAIPGAQLRATAPPFYPHAQTAQQRAPRTTSRAAQKAHPFMRARGSSREGRMAVARKLALAHAVQTLQQCGLFPGLLNLATIYHKLKRPPTFAPAGDTPTTSTSSSGAPATATADSSAGEAGTQAGRASASTSPAQSATQPTADAAGGAMGDVEDGWFHRGKGMMAVIPVNTHITPHQFQQRHQLSHYITPAQHRNDKPQYLYERFPRHHHHPHERHGVAWAMPTTRQWHYLTGAQPCQRQTLQWTLERRTNRDILLPRVLRSFPATEPDRAAAAAEGVRRNEPAPTHVLHNEDDAVVAYSGAREEVRKEKMKVGEEEAKRGRERTQTRPSRHTDDAQVQRKHVSASHDNKEEEKEHIRSK